MNHALFLPNYFDMMEMSIIDGDQFDESKSDNYCIINEKASEVLGFSNPVGQKVVTMDKNKPYIIKGVVKDAYTKSLHRNVDPQIYLKVSKVHSGYVLMVKFSGSPDKVIELLKQQWDKIVPQAPFIYHFLDEDYEKLYKAEAKSGKIVTWAVFIILLITLAGLWGIARYSTERRTKEIGIRKVNGAKLLEILSMINMDFIKWLTISFVIACPIGWIFMNSWLNTFALKTKMHWWIFLLSGVIPLIIAIAAITWQSLKVATRNPVEALRYE